jgi:hypothetical protein
VFDRLFTGLRALVYLRQIVAELKRANDLNEARLENEHPAWYKARIIGKRKGPTKIGEISTGQIERWNEEFSKRHPEEDTDNPY